MIYTPDKYVMIKITFKETNEIIYKIFGTWYGGYLNGDSWRMNSGIKRIEECDNYYNVFGESGSLYRCIKHTEGFSSYSHGIYLEILKRTNDKATVEIVDIKEFGGCSIVLV